MRILVLGYLVRGPLGGLAWHYLHYLLGLRALNHDVYFIEDSDDYPSCYDPSRHVTDQDPSYGLDFASKVLAQIGFENRWAYFDAHRNEWRGPLGRSAAAICPDSDLLINVSGIVPLRDWLSRVPARVFIDTDPMFEQIRISLDSKRRDFVSRHTHFFSFAENIGRPGCSIPDCGLAWKATRQPVFLDAWPVLPTPPEAPLTTILQWESYPAVEYNGQRFGLKSDSFAELMDLPSRSRIPIELAIGSPNAPRAELQEKGWRITDPLEVTRTPWTYQEYIRRSRGEFGVSKHAYVVSRSGWFSERSACYLASGRPVLAQETGFSDHLRSGSGLLPFSDIESAGDGIERIVCEPSHHARGARDVAEEFFDSHKVLRKLLERVT